MSPIQTSKAVSTANRIVVRRVFIHRPPLVVSYGLKERSQDCPSLDSWLNLAYEFDKNQVPICTANTGCFENIPEETNMRFGVVFPQTEIGTEPMVIRDYAQARKSWAISTFSPTIM